MSEDPKVRFISLETLLEKSPTDLLREVPEDIGDDYLQALTDQIDEENEIDDISESEKPFIWLIVKIGDYCQNYEAVIAETSSEDEKEVLLKEYSEVAEKQLAINDFLQKSMEIRLKDELEPYIHCYPASDGKLYGCRGICTFCEEEIKSEGYSLQ